MFWKRRTQNEGLSPAAVFFNTKQQQWERVWPGAIIPSFADQAPQVSDLENRDLRPLLHSVESTLTVQTQTNRQD